MYSGDIAPHSTTVPPSGNANEIDLPHSKGTDLLNQSNRARIGHFMTSSFANTRH